MKILTERPLNPLLHLLLLCALFAVAPLPARAEAGNRAVYASAKDVPNPQLSDAGKFVTDCADVLSVSEIDSLNRLIGRLRRQTGVQVAAVILPSIGDRDIIDFGNDLLRLWGIGDKESNNGLLILSVQDLRRVRIEVGYGLEGTVTDAESGRILHEYILPFYKKGRFGRGLIAGVSALGELIAKDGSFLPPTSAKSETPEIPWLLLAGLYCILCFSIFRGLWQQPGKTESDTPLAAYLRSRPGRRITPAQYPLLILFFPAGIALLLLLVRQRAKTGKKALACPLCKAENAMGRVTDPGARAACLTHGAAVEEQIGSMKHEVYACRSCRIRTEVVSFVHNPEILLCPECRYRTLMKIGSVQKASGSHAYPRAHRAQSYSYGIIEESYRCANCGHNEIYNKPKPPGNSVGNAALLGLFLGSLGSGGRSGGGFGSSGGGWGGGSSGGGGATGSW